LKVEAAKLGANGLMLDGFSDAQTASVGTGVGSQSERGRFSCRPDNGLLAFAENPM